MSLFKGNKLGLCRNLSFDDRREIEDTIDISFEDIYGHIETVEGEMREFEKLLKRIFHGEAAVEDC